MTDYVELLNSAVPDLRLTSFGGSVPVEGFGTLGDRFIYYRFRYNNAFLETFTTEEAFNAGDDPIEVAAEFQVVPNDPYLGTPLEPEAQVNLFQRLVTSLQPHDPETNPSFADLLRRSIEALEASYKQRD